MNIAIILVKQIIIDCAILRDKWLLHKNDFGINIIPKQLKIYNK